MRLSPLLLPLALALACLPVRAQEGAAEPEVVAPDDPDAALAERDTGSEAVPLDEIRRYVAVFNMVREAYV